MNANEVENDITRTSCQSRQSPILGLKLKEAMDKFKIECVYVYTVEFDGNPNAEMLKFFRKHFGLE